MVDKEHTNPSPSADTKASDAAATDPGSRNSIELHSLQKQAMRLHGNPAMLQLKSLSNPAVQLFTEHDTDAELILRCPLPENPQISSLPSTLAERYLLDYMYRIRARLDTLTEEQAKIRNANFRGEDTPKGKRQLILDALLIIKLVWNNPMAGKEHTDSLLERYNQKLQQFEHNQPNNPTAD